MATKSERVCNDCSKPGGDGGCGFRPDPRGRDTRLTCRRCAARRQRRASDYAALRPDDFAVGVANDGRTSREASAEKRQEWSEAMGEFAEDLRASGGDPDEVPGESGTYVGRLAEQERRFGNRRLARSVSLSAAHEELALRRFKQAAARYLRGVVTPTGYALKGPGSPRKRSVVLLLSDLHVGADLSGRDNPQAFGAVEEARRLEYVVRQALDYKPEHRADSELVVLLDGDLVDGMLLHDLRDGAPLTEQCVAFWKYARAAVGLFAQQYPRVRVECQPGNHGRDKLRHPGRATSSKWDGHEWRMMFALAEMCSSLPNVAWNLPLRSAHVVDLQGSGLLLSHGDTELPLGDPDTRSVQNAQALDAALASGTYGRFDAAAFGHFHKARVQHGNVRVVWNGALVPPNGYARTAGHVRERCGQWLWEAIEGYPLGDMRFVEVGPAQDRDERLGKLIEPFRFEGRGAASGARAAA